MILGRPARKSAWLSRVGLIAYIALMGWAVFEEWRAYQGRWWQP